MLKNLDYMSLQKKMKDSLAHYKEDAIKGAKHVDPLDTEFLDWPLQTLLRDTIRD
jgi:hypothetical protein